MRRKPSRGGKRKPKIAQLADGTLVKASGRFVRGNRGIQMTRPFVGLPEDLARKVKRGKVIE
jgi:hypothetical protein